VVRFPKVAPSLLFWPMVVKLPTTSTPVPVCSKPLRALKLLGVSVRPPLWLKRFKPMPPALDSVPPVWSSVFRSMPPAPTFSVPAIMFKPPWLVPNVSMKTGAFSANAVTCSSLKLTTTLLGIVTAATFAKSGTAPSAQLAGSNQLPALPPVQVTVARRVMLVELAVWSVIT